MSQAKMHCHRQNIVDRRESFPLKWTNIVHISRKTRYEKFEHPFKYERTEESWKYMHFGLKVTESKWQKKTKQRLSNLQIVSKIKGVNETSKKRQTRLWSYFLFRNYFLDLVASQSPIAIHTRLGTCKRLHSVEVLQKIIALLKKEEAAPGRWYLKV